MSLLWLRAMSSVLRTHSRQSNNKKTAANLWSPLWSAQ